MHIRRELIFARYLSNGESEPRARQQRRFVLRLCMACQIAGPRFGNYQDGFRFGRLGYELVEKRGLKRFQARTYMSFGNIVMPWTRHVLEGRDLVRRAFEPPTASATLHLRRYSCNHLIHEPSGGGRSAR